MAGLIVTLIKILFVILVTLTAVAYASLAERKVSAWIQWRRGPNRVGPWGLFQPLADGLKFVMKEDFTPAGANGILHAMAPVLAMAPALVTFAVIPFGDSLPLPNGEVVRLVIADLSIGILFVFAISSLGVFGTSIGGWASNNKYALFGSLRAGAQMISYEVSMGLAVIPVIMFTSSLRLTDIVAYQADHLWFVVTQPISFLLFAVAAFAETNRLPFDLPEAEPELVAGYHTEYSSMKFAMFYLGEYANLITASALLTTIFFGGYHLPWIENLGLFRNNALLLCLLQVGTFVAKVLIWVFIFMWVRWSLPRFRYDQLMHLGWRIMLPLALVNLFFYGLISIGRLG